MTLASSTPPKPVLYKTRDRSADSAENCAPDGGWFSLKKAAAAVAWIEKYCRHSKGEWAGKPLILDPNSRQMVEDIWGWRRADNGFRLHRKVFDAEPRKNGKSTKASALGLALTVGDGEPAAEVYSIAGNEAQATLVFTEGQRMVAQSPELTAKTELLKKRIWVPENYSFWTPLPSNASTQHGLNPHAVIGDEVHEWAGREQYDVMSTAMGARRQPLEFYITTAGDDLQSLCWELWKYALKIRDGAHSAPWFLPIIFAADPDDDPGDPATWAKANPNYGISVKPERLQQEYAEAVANPAKMNAFKRLYLNLWVESSGKWMPISTWKKDGNAAPFNEDDLVGRPCFAGLDLAWKHDISAFVLLFPPAGGDPCWRVICRFFIANHGLMQRAKADFVPYDEWARDGHLTLTEGNVTDFDVIEAQVIADHRKFKFKQLGFDRFMAGQVVNNLAKREIECVEVGQGFISTALPMVEIERAAEAGQFRHGGNPILQWMALNVVADIDKSGNKRPNKLKSADRIDGIPATLNAMALALAAGGEKPNPYNSRPILVLRS